MENLAGNLVLQLSLNVNWPPSFNPFVKTIDWLNHLSFLKY